MTENTSRDGAVPDEAQALAEDIKQTQEQIGEAVETLAATTDVKARVRDKVGRVSGRVQGATARAWDQAKDRSKRVGGQLTARIPAARRALPVAAAGIGSGSATGVITYLAVRRWGKQ